jgi:uncharacterized protein YndB with AHSA1/START domain
MTDEHQGASSRTAKVISAPPEALYAAFLDPAALAAWLPAAGMTGEIHAFDMDRLMPSAIQRIRR